MTEVSKESIIKKRLEKLEKEVADSGEPSNPPAKTPEVTLVSPLMRQPRRKLNRRFLLMLGIWVAALIAALYFLTVR
jgi:hypothetical protein